ncbi:MAG: cytochrome C oxidase subunit III [Flavobacteriaceae bacterium]|nr:MAG: cytochrome C oxidase subunit III [Flavobacteriaceae bacterium]
MKNTGPWWIRIPVVFFIIIGMMEYFINSGDMPAFIEYPIIQFFMLLVLLILIAIELIVTSIENVMFQTLSEEAKERYLTAKAKRSEWTWGKNMYKKLTGNKAIEEEGEIVLDHNYDGIRELDNKLPPWWVYMFYATIIFAVVYMLRFHVFNGYTQKMEYEQEMIEAKTALEAYKKTAVDLVDANTVELLTDPADLEVGKNVYTANCIACHMADGGGGIGPNLTDENWLLGGGIKNIYSTISEGGRDGKGMVAWKQSLKPSQIAKVASYIISLQGTTPANPKAAEGDIWIAEETP